MAATTRTRRRVGKYTGDYEVLGDFELAPAEAEEAESQITQAESERAEMHVTLRWGRIQLDVVRRASRLYGMPYQAYVKQAAFRQALADLKEASMVGFGPAIGSEEPGGSPQTVRELLHSRGRKVQIYITIDDESREPDLAMQAGGSVNAGGYPNVYLVGGPALKGPGGTTGGRN
jgi:hypothetical protein